MTWDDYDETNNRLIVRQNKTGANVSIPVHSILQKALKQAARNGETVLTTNKGGQFGVDYFSHRWLNASKNAKIDGLRFQDLRRTAIVRMGEAGSTVPEIAAVSGHTISSAHQILRTYLPTNENMAVRAIRKWEKAEESERELAEKGDRKSREGTFRKSEKMTAQKPLKRITNLARKDR